MTKYRLISNGHWNYLQYEYTYKFLYFWNKSKWRFVWKPYYDKITGTYYIEYPDTKGYVNSLDGIDPHEFIKKWPDINKYYKWANNEQQKLINISKEYLSKIENKRNKIEYL